LKKRRGGQYFKSPLRKGREANTFNLLREKGGEANILISSETKERRQHFIFLQERRGGYNF